MTEHMIPRPDFFKYCESLGFFETMQGILPRNFFVLFEMARAVPQSREGAHLHALLDAMAADGTGLPDASGRDLADNRIMKDAPAGETMETRRLKHAAEIRNLVPSELLLDNDLFDRRLMEKSLRVRHFSGARGDRFLPVASLEGKGRMGEQRLYILLDRSRSMEKNMRSLYSRYIIAEYLRRKKDTGAEIFFRPFDAMPGGLMMGKGGAALAGLVSAVLLAETRGSGTNIERAILQVADDISARRDMARSEILLVTDCAGTIDRYHVREKLGQTRLNIVKIGDEFAGPHYSAIKSLLDRKGLAFHSPGMTLHDMIHSLGKDDRENISPSGREARRIAGSFMKDIYEDLKSVSARFIETGDMDMGSLDDISPEDMDALIALGEKLKREARNPLDADAGKMLYKKASFLSQYLRFLMERSGSSHADAGDLREKLTGIMATLLRDPLILDHVSEMTLPVQERKAVKAARADMRKRSGAALVDISRRRKGLMKMGLRVDGAPVAAGSGIGSIVISWIMEIIKRLLRFIFSAQDHR